MLAGVEAVATPGGKEVAFRAVRVSRWPAGLVPLFEVSRDGAFELSRLPALDSENSSEPLFFALPAAGESEALRLCGHWEFRAVRNGSTSLTALEMTVWNGRVSARFDQNTDYGFASFSRGTFENNRLRLTARYIADAYELQALWEDGVLRGNWRDLGDSERGTWEAVRREGPIVSEAGAVPLFEWIRQSDGARRCAVGDGAELAQEWRRADRPLCRVWR